MRKLFILLSVCITLLTVALIIVFSISDSQITEEIIYSVKTNYTYLDNEKNYKVKVFSNDDNSMISYAEEAACYLHDFKEEEKTSIKIIDSYLSDSYIYQDSIYYEYTLVFELKISKVKINDCYLTLKFNSKAYTFNIGSFEIVDKVVSNNPLIITNLYGLTKNEEASLKGIVITITNPFDYDVIIQDVFIGSNHHVILNTLNKTEIKDSNKIEDYKYVYEERKLLLKANEEATFLLPIEVIKDYYLSECFLIFKIGDIDYCLKNFTFVKTNDLSTVNKYLNEGMIYAV